MTTTTTRRTSTLVMQSSQMAMHIIAFVGVLWLFVLPKDYRDVFTRHAMLLVGLWHLLVGVSGGSGDDKLLVKQHQKQALHNSSSNDQQQRKQRRPRQVSFGHVDVVEFPTILGDSPSTRDGPPVALGYTAVRRFTVHKNVMAWRHQQPKSDRKPMVLHARERELLLLSKGYSFQEIDMAAARVYERQKEIQKQQQQIMQHQQQSSTPFLALKTKVKGMVQKRRQQRQQRRNSAQQ